MGGVGSKPLGRHEPIEIELNPTIHRLEEVGEDPLQQVDVAPVYGPEGGMNAETVTLIYERMAGEFKQAIRSGGALERLNFAVQDLKNNLDAQDARHSIKVTREIQLDIHKDMKDVADEMCRLQKLVTVPLQLTETSDIREAREQLAVRLNVMAVIARHMEYIQSHHIMTHYGQPELARNDERNEVLKLNEGNVKTINVGLGGSINAFSDPTGKLHLGIPIQVAYNVQERSTFDPNGPEVQFYGRPVQLMAGIRQLTNYLGAPLDTPGYNEVADTGSFGNLTVTYRPEYFEGVNKTDKDRKIYRDTLASRNQRAINEKRIVENTRSKQNEGFWGLRNRWVSDSPASLSEKWAVQQFVDDKHNVNKTCFEKQGARGCLNATTDLLKGGVRKVQEKLGFSTGKNTQTDPTPFSSLMVARGATSDPLLQYVEDNADRLNDHALTKAIDKAYSDLKVDWDNGTNARIPIGPLAPFRGAMKTVGAYLNGNLALYKPELLNRQTRSETISPNFSGQIGVEKSQWLYNFETTPSTMLDPSLNGNIDGLLDDIQKTAPRLLELRKAMIRDCTKDRWLNVEQYAKLLQQRTMSFMGLATLQRQFYAMWLTEGASEDEKKSNLRDMKKVARTMVKDFMPGGFEESEEILENLITEHHEEFMSMVWTSVSLAAGIFSNSRSPQEGPAQEQALKPGQQPPRNLSEEVLGLSEQRMLDTDVHDELELPPQNPVSPPFKIDVTAVGSARALEELKVLRDRINKADVGMPLDDLYQKSPLRLQINGLDTQLLTIKGSVALPFLVYVNHRVQPVLEGAQDSFKSDMLAQVDLQVDIATTSGHHDPNRNGMAITVRAGGALYPPEIRGPIMLFVERLLRQEFPEIEIGPMVPALLRHWPAEFNYGVEFNSANEANLGRFQAGSKYQRGMVMTWTWFKVDSRDPEKKSAFKLQSRSFLSKDDVTEFQLAGSIPLTVTAQGALSINASHTTTSLRAIHTQLYDELTIHAAQYPGYFKPVVEMMDKKVKERVDWYRQHFPQADQADLVRHESNVRAILVDATEESLGPELRAALKTLYETYLHSDGECLANVVEEGLRARNEADRNQSVINSVDNLSQRDASKNRWNQFRAAEYPTADDIRDFRESMQAIRSVADETDVGFNRLRNRQLQYLFNDPVGRKVLNGYGSLMGCVIDMRTNCRFGTKDEPGTCNVAFNTAVGQTPAHFKALAEKKLRNEEELNRLDRENLQAMNQA